MGSISGMEFWVQPERNCPNFEAKGGARAGGIQKPVGAEVAKILKTKFNSEKPNKYKKERNGSQKY